MLPTSVKKAAWLSLVGASLTGVTLGLFGHQKAGLPPIEVPLTQLTLPTDSQPIRLLHDLSYGSGPRQKLDFYLPVEKSFPVIIFVHGGRWTEGDRTMYGHLGRYFAANGIGCVIPSFRVYPEVKCDGEMADLATVFSWVQAHSEEYGGQKGRLFLAGHSSGGHMVSLLATNPQFLQTVGHKCSEIKGVVSISGVYVIDWNMKVAGLNHIFDGLDKAQYSPYNYVSKDSPPFLVLYAENDYRHLGRQARGFMGKMNTVGTQAELFVVPKEDHTTEIIHLVLPEAPHGKKIIEWAKTK